MTQKIIPAIGFKIVGDTWSGARPLRPLQQVLSHQYRDWRIPARFVRNALWSIVPPGAALRGWEISEVVGENEQRFPCVGALRSDLFFKYLQACPTATIRLFEIRQDGCRMGRIALSVVHGQARIAGIWLNNPTEENLYFAYVLAQRAARAMGSAFEITTTGSTPASERAAISAGMRIRKHTPIYLLSDKVSAPPGTFDFQMIDTDAVFQSAGEPSYWT